MRIKQLSVFLENRSGRLANIAMSLGESGINIRAMSLADSSEFGILRLIVSDPMKARQVLKERGFTLSLTDVIAVEIPDKPGALGNLLMAIEKTGLNIEYMYAYGPRHAGLAVMIFRFHDIDDAILKMTGKGIAVLEAERVLNL